VNGTIGGYIKRFCYKQKPAAEWVRTGWLMAEYSYGSSDTVLCKVYYIRLHQERPSSSAAQTTTTPTTDAPAASGYQGTLQGGLGPLQEAERFLMIDDDEDDGRGLTMALQIIPPHHEDMDAFFESYLLGGEGVVTSRTKPWLRAYTLDDSAFLCAVGGLKHGADICACE
jgi:hypothetical protein